MRFKKQAVDSRQKQAVIKYEKVSGRFDNVTDENLKTEKEYMYNISGDENKSFNDSINQKVQML